jgi:hypothetical protein
MKSSTISSRIREKRVYLQELPPNAWGRLTTPTYPECSGRCCLPIANSYREGAGFVVGVFPKVFGSGSAFKYYLLPPGVFYFPSFFHQFSTSFLSAVRLGRKALRLVLVVRWPFERPANVVDYEAKFSFSKNSLT